LEPVVLGRLHDAIRSGPGGIQVTALANPRVLKWQYDAGGSLASISAQGESMYDDAAGSRDETIEEAPLPGEPPAIEQVPPIDEAPVPPLTAPDDTQGG
jgi:hypothetical protein